MKKKMSFYDIIAACAMVFNVDWDKEYDLLEVDDIFWDTSDWQRPVEVVEIIPVQDKRMQVS